MQPTNNAFRRDASPLECSGDSRHGLPGRGSWSSGLGMHCAVASPGSRASMTMPPVARTVELMILLPARRLQRAASRGSARTMANAAHEPVELPSRRRLPKSVDWLKGGTPLVGRKRVTRRCGPAQFLRCRARCRSPKRRDERGSAPSAVPAGILHCGVAYRTRWADAYAKAGGGRIAAAALAGVSAASAAIAPAGTRATPAAPNEGGCNSMSGGFSAT